jgi:hypothetical protein
MNISLACLIIAASLIIVNEFYEDSLCKIEKHHHVDYKIYYLYVM